ncbi:hypothetical protein AC579_9715 [Pseudocercospora musae]|uniref:Uncharacterized protein n=1 Tax=Pseudocercospora musae TaxID=113226 RepID=A0A139I5V8_9PEZI|nr:hypothetical protein AC579_9715 [Pseudocercospora musae]
MLESNQRPSNRRVDALRKEAAGKIRERQKSRTAARRTNMREEELSEVMASLSIRIMKSPTAGTKTPTSSMTTQTPPALEIPMAIDTLVASDVDRFVQDIESAVAEDTPMRGS